MTPEQHAQAEAEGTELLIAALKERNAALEADKRRLDWLEQEMDVFLWLADEPIRPQIDAAMEAKP